MNYGHGPSASNIDNLNLVSSVEALRSAWLFELWYQQAFLGGAVGRAARAARRRPGVHDQHLRQLARQRRVRLAHAALGRPAGGRPQSSIGNAGGAAAREANGCAHTAVRRLQRRPSRAGPRQPAAARTPPASCFRLGDRVFAIAEAQYAINGGKDAKGPPVTLKVGGLVSQQGDGETSSSPPAG